MLCNLVQSILTSSCTAMECHLPYRITQCYLPPDTFAPARQAYAQFTYPGGMEGWVYLGDLLHTKIENDATWWMVYRMFFLCCNFVCGLGTPENFFNKLSVFQPWFMLPLVRKIYLPLNRVRSAAVSMLWQWLQSELPVMTKGPEHYVNPDESEWLCNE